MSASSAGAQVIVPVTPGDLLANGRYRVEEVLGVGGMGVVCAATHVGLGQRVAIKFLLPEALEHPQAIARFEREARASASLTSEHVVRVTDVGTLENGSPYFVMEFLQGEDLAQRIRRQGPLEIRAALTLMAQACEGLIEAHAKGLVHRDIKPSNLFLAKRASGKSVLKVIDFGIAKAEVSAEGGGHELTRTSDIMGSPQYMSPEQLRDTKNVDARTDIWSLGASFYECLAGRPPFTGDTMTELVVRIATEEVPSPQLARPDLPDEVAAILNRCLAKKVSERYASATELLEAIERLRGSANHRIGTFASSPEFSSREGAGSDPFIAFDETSGPIASTQAVPLEAPERSALAPAAKKRGLFVLLGIAGLAAVALLFVARGRGEARLRVEGASSASEAPAAASPAEVSRPAPVPLFVEAAPGEAAAKTEPASVPRAQVATAPARPSPKSAKGGALREPPSAASAVPSPAAKAEVSPVRDAGARTYNPGFE